jgi:hypothetical protein
VLFTSTLFDAAGANVNASGGLSSGNAGGDGRYVTSDNSGVAPNYGTFTGASREQFIGLAARSANPYVTGGAGTTSNLVGLVGGADVYGIKEGVSASDEYFQQIRVGAPAGALAAVVRRTVGPSQGAIISQSEQYASSELLMMVNLTNQPLAAPKLGVGPEGSGFSTSLAERGFAKNPLFGGAGSTDLASLAAHQVFATLVNTGDAALEVNASAGGLVMTPTTFGTLDVVYLLPPLNFLAADFNRDGDVDAGDLLAWKSGFGAAGALKAQGDADGDQDVDGADFLAWQRQLGQLPSNIPSATSVPEPSTNAVCLGLASGVIGRWRRLRAPLKVA